MAQEVNGEIWTKSNFKKKEPKNPNIIKLSLGNHLFRLLPNKLGSEDILYTYCQHWLPVEIEIKGELKKINLPITHPSNEPCKACLLQTKLYSQLNKLREEGKEKTKEFEDCLSLVRVIKSRYLRDVNCIDRNDALDENNQIRIKLLTLNKSLFDKISTIAKPVEENGLGKGSPTNDVTGYNLYFMVTKKSEEFNEYNVNFDERTPLTPEELQALNDRGFDLAAERSKDFTPDSKIDEILASSTLIELNELVTMTKDELKAYQPKIESKKEMPKFTQKEVKASDIKIELDDEDLKPASIEKPKKGKSVITAPEAPKVAVEKEVVDLSNLTVKEDDGVAEFDFSEKKVEVKADDDEDMIVLDADDLKNDLDDITVDLSDEEDDEEEAKETLSDYNCRGHYGADDEDCVACPMKDACKKLGLKAKQAEALGLIVYNGSKELIATSEEQLDEMIKSAQNPGASRKGNMPF